jgi:hypothetical protein
MSRSVLMTLCTLLLLAGCGRDTPETARKKLVKLQVEQSPEVLIASTKTLLAHGADPALRPGGSLKEREFGLEQIAIPQ